MEQMTPEDITKTLKERGILDAGKMESKDEPKDDIKDEVNEKQMPEKAEEKNAKEDAEETAVLDEVEAEVDQQQEVEVKELAAKYGWSEEGSKSASEFIEFALKNLEPRGKELKSLKAQMNQVLDHMAKLKKAGYEEKLESITAEREDAIARSDVESVDYYDQKMAEVKKELEEVNKDDSLPPAAKEFVEKHKDLERDFSLEAQEIKSFIHERDVYLAQFNLDPEEHIATLEKDLATKFPARYAPKEEARKPKAVAVESDSRPTGAKTKKKVTYSDLSPDQKTIYKTLEKKGVMSGADYIKQLQDLGEL